MSRRARTPDPFERRIESALRPGKFVSYGDSFVFAKGLDELVTQIEPLVDDNPERAADVYEAFLAGCYAKTHEIDDSSGELGNFMQMLCCHWVRARQSGGHPAGDTVETLVHWIDADEYGYAYQMERDLAEVLDDAGRTAFVKVARARFEQAAQEATRRKDEPGGDASKRQWADVLRALYRAQDNAFSYIRLCQEMGMRGEDCLVIADIFHAKDETNQALSWVRRGLEIAGSHDFATYDLERRERALLSQLGRTEEALTLAWKDFEASPHTGSYEELMRYVPEDERTRWHGRAMNRAGSAELWSTIELFVENRETTRLTDRFRSTPDEALMDVSRYALGDAAKHLTRPHPDVAARLFRAIALQIVNERKSKSYRSALSNLRRAKTCYEKAGRVDQWDSLVKDIRRRHHRKTSFMPKFEEIVQGEPAKDATFLDAAKKSWSNRRPRQS